MSGGLFGGLPTAKAAEKDAAGGDEPAAAPPSGWAAKSQTAFRPSSLLMQPPSLRGGRAGGRGARARSTPRVHRHRARPPAC
jgi:hypothetical protein